MSSPIGLILGSGWSSLVKTLAIKKTLDFEKVFHSKSAVPGHEGKVVFGSLKKSDKELVVLSGRFHTYEGYSSKEAVKTVEYLNKQGVRKIIISSACGGLNPKYQVGDLVILSDIITLFCQSPLTGAQFQNMSQPFSVKLINLAVKAAVREDLSFQKGTYVYFKGPHYETFADKMALRFLGADTCGMSTVPEVITANHLGMEVLGLSLVTNLSFVKHDHKEVLAEVMKKQESLKCFLQTFIDLI